MASTNSNNSNKRVNPEQIPKEDVSAEVEKVTSEQGGIEGQRKEVNVENVFKDCNTRTNIKGSDFPASKDKIVPRFDQQKDPDDSLLSLIRKIDDKQYQNVSDVTKADWISLPSKNFCITMVFPSLIIDTITKIRFHRILETISIIYLFIHFSWLAMLRQ